MKPKKHQQLDLFSWVKQPAGLSKRMAVLIPQFNECKNAEYYRRRLTYFSALAHKYAYELDIILIDDGSNDGSKEILTRFQQRGDSGFYSAVIAKNTQKVGALNLTAMNISHDYITVSDFDTDLNHLENLKMAILRLDNSKEYMGCYFRMYPFGERGLTFKMQQLEYCFARTYYKLHQKEQTVPVMPGAGSCYRRTMLLDIYKLHSGLRSGEDREAATIGARLNLKVFYFENVEALTRPPGRLPQLISQRVRWYTGYIETVIKERTFYFSQIKSASVVGIRTLQDFASILLLLLFPALAGIVIVTSIKNLFIVLSITYCLSECYYFLLLTCAAKERRFTGNISGLSILVYPLFWLVVSFVSWWRAVIYCFSNYKKIKAHFNLNQENVVPGVLYTHEASV
ncbi:glycosyltransferase family 2 protein [Mucilaginibacter sp. KACC 22773]|uniref:glycosyltransferase n=1 Tax=Mucilaginibacter sp. KACC 22773 TaxID=3025671 RepID=UPI0023653630|nr:glycosyltransferase family 2 protein [Mucilaginibacter sp. KACC 22773]WDF77686.1 glycosyltransferase family 2 protein [Mucilaginibacter sp. KACC 22773]